MKITKAHIFVSIALVTLMILVRLWVNGVIDPNKTEINEGVFLVKEKGKYSIYYRVITNSRVGSGGEYNQRVAVDVDSIIVSESYGTLVRGLNISKNQREWYFLSPMGDKIEVEHYTSIHEASKNEIGVFEKESAISPVEAWKKFN